MAKVYESRCRRCLRGAAVGAIEAGDAAAASLLS